MTREESPVVTVPPPRYPAGDIRISSLSRKGEGFAAPSFLVEEYRNLENTVRGLITDICRPFCESCPNPCCREDICRETLDSIWLRTVWTSNQVDRSSYDDAEGWLTVSGCALKAGRPPVCYEFYCSRIMSSLGGAYQKYGLSALGNLMNFVGRGASGKSHLVTLSDPEELFNMHCGKIHKRIGEAYEALEDCMFLIRNDSACNSILRDLGRIQQVPKGLRSRKGME